MLAQEAGPTEEELEDLFAKTDDEAQGDKVEEATGEVEGAEAEECDVEGAVLRRALPDPGQPAQSQSRTIGLTTTPFGCGVLDVSPGVPLANSTELVKEIGRCLCSALATSS